MHDNRGFTLAELLVVIAIIAILVAVAIPVFHAQTEKAQIAVDQANVRDAKAAASVEYLSTGARGQQTYYYDKTGQVVADPTGLEGYGRYEGSDADGTITGAKGTPKDGVVQVIVNEGQTQTASWVNGQSQTQTAGLTQEQRKQNEDLFKYKLKNQLKDSKSKSEEESVQKVVASVNNSNGKRWQAGESIVEGDFLYISQKEQYVTNKMAKSIKDIYDELKDDQKENFVVVTKDTRVYSYDEEIQYGTETVKRGSVVSYNGRYYVVCKDNPPTTTNPKEKTDYYAELI